MQVKFTASEVKAQEIEHTPFTLDDLARQGARQRIALAELFGEAAKGFSPASIVRFKQLWETEYQAWQKRDLSETA